ncbi:MAG: DUF3109 family protein [Sphingobacteriaceae bacterium]|nr:DUF3109 family protein [Sphingobacteriaceae bacterium]
MIIIDDTLISEEILNNKFVCDLAACKGACCEEGDIGAPLEIEEIDAIEANLKGIRPFMSAAGLQLLDAEGFYEAAPGEELVTTTINGKACVFAIQDESKTWKCAIELAHKAGKSDFLKPISCHLYPIRIEKLKNYEGLNYDRWDICTPACACGDRLEVPVYKFLKGPLIRKYGPDWFEALEAVAAELKKNKA